MMFFRRSKFSRLRKMVERHIKEGYRGCHKYEGMIDRQPKGMPLGYVRYSEGYRSATMAIGNAADYMRMFGGRLVHAHQKS